MSSPAEIVGDGCESNSQPAGAMKSAETPDYVHEDHPTSESNNIQQVEDKTTDDSNITLDKPRTNIENSTPADDDEAITSGKQPNSPHNDHLPPSETNINVIEDKNATESSYPTSQPITNTSNNTLADNDQPLAQLVTNNIENVTKNYDNTDDGSDMDDKDQKVIIGVDTHGTKSLNKSGQSDTSSSCSSSSASNSSISTSESSTSPSESDKKINSDEYYAIHRKGDHWIKTKLVKHIDYIQILIHSIPQQ